MPGVDITGQTFGALTALEATSGRVHRSVVWKFQCGCGQVVERSRNSVVEGARRGNPSSCGCLNRGRASPGAIDLNGARYGRLTVVACDGSGAQGLRWRCVCDCGNSTVARTKDLRAGTTTSCGCSRGAGAGRRRARNGRTGRTVADGEKFGRLTVREFASIEKGMRYYWCTCECGGVALVRGGLLVSGQTKSCGCLRGRPAAEKKAHARAVATQTAGKTAADLRASPEFRLQLNAETAGGRLATCESEAA